MFINFSACKSGEKVSYKEIRLQNDVIEFKTHETTMYSAIVRYRDRVFSITTDDEVRLIDMANKREQILFKKGIGPNEVYEPWSIRLFDKKCWVCPIGPGKYIYYFSPDTDTPSLDRIELKNQVRFDDFDFLSKDEVLMTFPIWEDGLLLAYNRKTGDEKKFGKSKIIDLMLRFNVSIASLELINNKAYITQSIIPEIQVISLENLSGDIDKIKLSPPFYIPIPDKYITNKYDHKAHKKWMESWASISDIMSYNDWILVVYRYGYEYLYSYELFNLKNMTHRYYINKTISRIYNFKIDKNKAFFDICNQEEESVIWKKSEAFL